MRVAVIGAGSWGTALAVHLAGLGHRVRLWAREPEVVEEVRNEGFNSAFLPEIPIPEGVKVTGRLDEALEEAEILLSVVPSQFVRSIARRMRPHLPAGTLIVSATKGIENDTLARMDAVFREELGEEAASRFSALTGPSFAKEVARRHPTVVVAAAENPDDAAQAQSALASEYFRVYTIDDVTGALVCGAVKNVIALASGTVSGLGFGDNTRAALITRGLAETARLVKAVGGRRRTVAGLAGIGDMVLTCTSTTSRNFSVGQRLGRGESLEQITFSMQMIAEGVETTRAVAALAKQEGVEMPISEAMYGILYEGLRPRDAVRRLMTRELKSEWEPEPGGQQ